MRSARISAWTVFLALAGLCPAMPAQSSPATPPSAPASTTSQKPEAGKPAPQTFAPIDIGHHIIFSGSVRDRVENWNFFNSPAADGEYTFNGAIIRAGLSQKSENYDWVIEAAVPVLSNLPTNSTSPAPGGALGLGANYFSANANSENSAAIFVKQAFLRLVSHDDRFSSARFGRFEFIEGLENAQKDATLGFLKRERIAHRVVGNFAFTDVGRSFDGIEFKRDNGKSTFDLMAGRATRGVFQTDGTGELDVDIQYGSFTHQIKLGRSPGEWRIFALGYHDGRLALKSDNRSAAARAADTRNIRIGTFGAHYIQTAEFGKAKVDTLLWAALQYGSWGIQEHLAGAVSAEVGIQPAWQWKPWLRFGADWTTGDGNAADGKHGTFFEPLGTPRIYARFPFYNHMNMGDVFTQLLLRPTARLTMRTEYHYLRLSSANDLWYAGGGAFAPRNFGMAGRPSNGNNDLGSVLDFGIDYNMNLHTTVNAYYAHAFGGEVIKAIFPTRPDADYAFLEILFRF